MMKRNRATAAGFSLLELLLTTGVLFTLLIAVFLLMQSFGEKELARATNKYMATVAAAMNETLSNLDNYHALYMAARANGGGYQLVADSAAGAADNIAKTFTLPAVTVDGVTYPAVTIQGSRLLNAQFRDTPPIRSNIRILLRVADDVADPNDTPALDVLLLTSRPRPDNLVRRAATESGPHGGFIRTYAAKGDARIVSAFRTWQVNPGAGLQNTAWYNTDLNADLDSGEDGSYLAYYMYKSIEEVGGDYLYRVRDVDPALRRNAMYGPLNIGGNDIYGGDDVTIGDALPPGFGGGTSARPLTAGSNPGLNAECENTLACVTGTAVVKGSASIAGRMTTAGSALIADSSRMRNLRIENDLNPGDRQNYNAQSHLVVDGNGNDGGGTQDRVHVLNNAQFEHGATVARGNLTTINNTTLTMPDGGTLNAGTIDARRISASEVSANRLAVDNQLRSGIVQNGNIRVQNGAAGVIDIKESRDLTFGAPGISRSIRAPRINIDSMNIQTFGVCGSGCQD